MKFALILFFISTLQIFATAYSQSTRLTLNLKNASIEDVFEAIEKQSDFKFLYHDALINGEEMLSLNISNETVEDILNELFAETGNNYTVLENNLVVITPGNVKVKQQKMITGVVVSASTNEPLPGVNIVEKGTLVGAVTDLNGRYSIEVSGEDVVLVFSYVGYVPEEVAVNGQTTIDISMVEDIASLEEVVVIGYGTQKRGDITGAVAQINTEDLNERPVNRIDQALVGQMAGVRIKQTSGVAGKGLSIQIRGTGSISANNEPLYVIDGFPLEVSSQDASGNFVKGNPLDNINPNDIESIQVLKDASAAAIYGSRGSNGVVIIKTKSGKTGKARISFNAYGGWNERSRKLDMLSSEEWVDRALEMINHTYIANDPGDQNRQATDDYDTRVANIGSFNTNQVPDPRWTMPGHPGLTYYDMQDEMFRKGAIQNYQLSATGGNEYVKYYISGDYLNQDGFMQGNWYERYSARANVEIKASDKVTAGVNISPSYSIANDPGLESKDQQMHLVASVPPVSEDTVGLDFNTGDNPRYIWGSSRNSPIRVAQNTIGETRIFRTLATVFAEYEIISGLAIKTTFNLDNADQNYKYYKPAWVSGSGPGARTAGGRFSGYKRQTFVNENTLTFDKTIGNNHNISVVAGVSYSVNKFNDFRITASGDGFGTDYVTTLNDANGINTSNTATYTRETENVLLSYFGRLNYIFNNRYLLSAVIRRDGSSRFGKNTKWGLFPSVSAGWRLSEETFMQDLTVINNLKARVSWGISGNEAVGGDYEHIALLRPTNYSFGGNKAIGFSPDNFPNKDLSWEESQTFDIGLDFGLMDNRIYGSFDYYTKRNSDLLLIIPVPSAAGFTNPATNMGEVVTNIGVVLNKGWEIELNTRNLTGQFKWNTAINLSHNTNEVKELGPDNAPILGGAFDIQHNILMVGEPMYSLYIVQQDGILTQADIDAGAALYGSQVEGDPKYVDQITVDTDGDGVPDAKDGIISPDDRVLSGHPNPDYIWGITNTFNYRGFDLSILVQGQWGGKIYSIFGRAVDRTGQGWIDNAIGAWRDRWRSPEDPGAGLKGKSWSSFGRIKNTDWLYPSDYWRIRNITLGYDLGQLVKTKIISNVRIYATAENWFGKDKYTGGFNPEAVNTNGDDYGAAPLPRSVIFGINLTF
ncbi:MAG: TonB-dependent receptor [Bacteroidales bacterium]|nr:TonB-dependent receptor [Bacteroidales bacterium]